MSGFGGLGMMLMASLGDMLKKDNFVCDCARCDESDTCESRKPLTLEDLRNGVMVRHFSREKADPSSVIGLFGVHGTAKMGDASEEEMVRYSPAEDKEHEYLRPVRVFLAEVDKEENPDIRQTYQYERCRPEDYKALVFHIMDKAHEAMKASFEKEDDDDEDRKQ